ncbi:MULTISPECIES: alpha/beta hydrolase family protein [unclassified Bradyrhizobium]|uniref:alpha/beta hydrolase family protein n=1 Tax=unclassified Bradyrhizobium TaxID=2631580 RepID=UPI00211DBB90|nr:MULTISPECIES: alpha/beta hydrolase [unclassified Bradyrhizobium]MDD1532521.1 dienelactone hydrolase [Bradyrhizobium sp. WBOS8]MDD1582525.1 dienelactone hydrolase [Bradyrhizobium sp. WBOS4]UUO50836.1 dienelactone hydrolase [Bradyrhizobium sp. WBOS04]UUO58214.1 dienelactone hydrolase [Bradyrhizobium sp. WBOS08]
MALTRKLLLLIAGLVAAATPVRAAEFYTEDLRIPMAQAGPQGLEAFLVRPAGAKRYPLALLSHGSPRSFEDRATMSAHRYYGIALEYARRGFAALVVMRRGYGTSPGGRIDSVGGCAKAAYLPAAAIAVADLRAAIDAMARRADVTTSGMIAAGHSAGGLATIALTAQAPPGLVAAINFAGGRGSRDDDDVCNPNGLAQAFTAFGQSSRVPTLWVYAANDSYFGPELARRLHDGFRAGGGNATFVAAPPYGDEGHYLYSVAGRPQWTPYVDAFLRERGLLSRDILSPPDSLPPPHQLDEAARAEFSRYLASMLPHKAFAVSPNGGYGWRAGRSTADEAQRDSLAACLKWSPTCTLYAVDDRLASPPQTPATDQSARAR